MAEKWLSRYGTRHNWRLTPLELELYCYRHWLDYRKAGRTLPTQWTDHFRNGVNILWGPKNKTKSVEWNPWMEEALQAAHWHPTTGQPYPHTGMSGCASSGKTLYLALHGLMNWLCDPVDTLVMMTSTNLKDARKRVWAEVLKLWQAAEKVMPGQLIDSQGLIVTVLNGKKFPDTSGISLVAGEKRKEKEAIGKIIGAKNKRVFMEADELPELTEAILEASFSNLTTNDLFQFLAGGNFKARYDPFGVFIEPKEGYESLTLESDAWDTKYGHCIRFDGMRSPNITGGEDKWKGIYSSKHLKQHKQFYNEHQAGFWRMVRSFEAPIGGTDCIYSESDFVAGEARKRPVWLGDRVKVAFLDPSFTNGGDRSMLRFGMLGADVKGKTVLDCYKKVILREDARLKAQTRNFQIAEQFIKHCKDEGILPENAGLDSTAAGGVFADIVAELWKDANGQQVGNKIWRLDFSGAPTESLVSQGDHRTAKDRYDRRVTELWYVGVELLKCGQLKGLDDEVIREMKARKYDTVKGAEGLKMRVETKDAMKDRLGFSPDDADAFFGLIDLCRQRHKFLAATGFGGNTVQVADTWKKDMEIANDVYATVDYSEQEPFQELEGFPV